jgi:hypothetical protein
MRKKPSPKALLDELLQASKDIQQQSRELNRTADELRAQVADLMKYAPKPAQSRVKKRKRK